MLITGSHIAVLLFDARHLIVTESLDQCLESMPQAFGCKEIHDGSVDTSCAGENADPATSITPGHGRIPQQRNTMVLFR